MHKKRTNEQHDQNEEGRGPNPEKVEAPRVSARRVGPRRVGPELEKVRALSAWGHDMWGLPEGGSSGGKEKKITKMEKIKKKNHKKNKTNKIT